MHERDNPHKHDSGEKVMRRPKVIAIDESADIHELAQPNHHGPGVLKIGSGINTAL
jgi:hypothetical protein